MKKKGIEDFSRWDAFTKMDAVLSTVIPDPGEHHLRSLSGDVLAGYAVALDGYLEAIQREWVRRKMAEEIEE